MAWIESHTNLDKHHKLIRFQTAMRWSRNEAVGFLHRFWWSVLEVSPSGDVTALTSPEVMSETLNMKLDVAQDAILRLEECGFLDNVGGRLLVHGWLDYAGRYLSESLYRRHPEKMAQARSLHVLGQSSDSPGIVPDTLPDQPNQPNQKHTSPPAASWDRFWEAYPRKTAKQAALRAWRKIRVDDGLLALMLSALERQRQSDQWARDGGKFIPHPATWLNGRRWEDEVKAAPPKPGEPGYTLTDLDKVIAGYRNAKGIPKDDAQWRLVMWERQRSDAKALLDYFLGDWRAAVNCIAYTSEKCHGMDWGWKAVMSRAPEIKNVETNRVPV